MIINKDNYEAYFIDYLDGNLDEQTVAALQLFLDLHPELKEELGGLEDVYISPSQFSQLLFKDQLKRDTSGLTTVDRKMIAALEGDLTENEHKAFIAEVATNKRLSDQWRLWNSTLLKADEQLVYEGKDKLKRSVLRPIFTTRIFRYTAVAAAVLLGIYLSTDEPEFPKHSSNKVAKSLPKEKRRFSPHATLISSEQENAIAEKRVVVEPKYIPAKQIRGEDSSGQVVVTEAMVETLQSSGDSIAVVNFTPIVKMEDVFTDEDLTELMALVEEQAKKSVVENTTHRTLLERVFGIRTTRTEKLIDNQVILTLEAGPLSARHVKTTE